MATLSTSLQRSGTAAVGTVALVSLLSVVALISYMGFCALRRPEGSTAYITRSQFGALFSGLVFSDLLQSLGFTSSYGRLINAATDPSNVPTSCIAQSVLINAGDVGTACFSTFIALHTVYVVGMRKKPPTWTVGVAIFVVLAMMLVLTAIGPTALATAEGGPFFISVGFWCWISPSYQPERLTLHYAWTFLAAITNVSAYVSVAVLLWLRPRFSWSKEQRASKRLDALAKRMLLFPICYFVTMLPLAIARVVAMAGHTVSFRVILAAGLLFSTNGAINTILFGLTHHFFKLPTPGFSLYSRSSAGVRTVTLPSSAKMSDVLESKATDALDFNQMMKEGLGQEGKMASVNSSVEKLSVLEDSRGLSTVGRV